MTLRTLFAVGVLMWMAAATAATLYVTSISASEVQVIINGNVVRTLRIGDVSPEGVKLAEIRGGTAYLEVGGSRLAMSIGSSTQSDAVLRADSRGHFPVNALINGVQVPALIDTGATGVTVNAEQARRMGIDLSRAQRGTSRTANGTAPIYIVTFARVQIGDIALANVPGTVVEGGTDRLAVALIGMSFLRHVEMRRSGDTMTLSRPNF